MSDKIFADGIIFKLPSEKAPDYVKGRISFKVDEAIQFLNKYSSNGWVNVDLLIGKSGKPYTALDTWKPSKESKPYAVDNGSKENDDLPF